MNFKDKINRYVDNITKDDCKGIIRRTLVTYDNKDSEDMRKELDFVIDQVGEYDKMFPIQEDE